MEETTKRNAVENSSVHTHPRAAVARVGGDTGHLSPLGSTRGLVSKSGRGVWDPMDGHRCRLVPTRQGSVRMA